MAKKDEGALVQREEMQPVSPFAEMDKYFENFFRNPFSMMSSSMLPSAFPKGIEITPSVDIFEEGDEVVVKADIPGVKKNDLDVTMTENSLTISGEKKQEKKVKEKDYHRVERSYGSFSRSFRLPENVNGSKAKAEFKDGVLEVRLPKTKESKQKKVEIK
ncbi:MAG TPA: Hsp20/alpha crystallin family protein [Desulfobulbaceae bacterium]|nr:Hsp20/alpha crystallin family protein [Desulfobulbaceae bacterium]